MRINKISDKILNFLEQEKESGNSGVEESRLSLDEEMLQREKNMAISQVEKSEDITQTKKGEEILPVKKHVLVVDDDPMMLRLIKEQLKDIYMVATAINGNLALIFLENKKTDLFLTINLVHLVLNHIEEL